MAPRAQTDLRRIVDAHLRAYAASDVEGWLELLADDVVIVSDLGEQRGIDGAREYAALVARDFGGLRLRLDRVVAETEETIVVELTHLAPDASADGVWTAVAEIVQIFEVRDGRIAEIRVWHAPITEDEDGTRRRAPRGGVHRVSAATAISNAEARDELRRLAEEQRALRRVATLVARGTSQGEMFDAVAVEASRVMGGDATALFRYEPDGRATVVAVCGLPVTIGTTVPADADGVVGEVHRTGWPARRDAYPADAVAGPAADRARRIGVRGSVGVPVVVAGRTWGVLTAVSWNLPLPRGTEERGAQFSDLVATAIGNAESRAELTASRARVVAAGDESRRRILRDLHDGAQQRLVHAIICLKEAQRAYGPDVPLIDEALAQAERTMAELRDLVHGIMPLALTQGGLAAGVRSLVEPLTLPVAVDVCAERLPELVETTAYLIVAEALTNTIKHARASGARVAAAVVDGALRLEVSDDGAGGAAAAGAGSATGIVGLVDRVGAIGGTLTLTSPPGEGTTLLARLPLDEPGPDAG